MKRQYRYATYSGQLDIDAFEAAIGFETDRQGVNKHGEPEDIGSCPDPWHLHKNGDTTGKFAINRDKQVYNCFVCGGGTLLDLARAVNDTTDQEAEEWLHQFSSPATVSNREFLDEIDAILAPEEQLKPILPYYNERVLKPWADEVGRLANWLTQRGISHEVALKHRVGFQADAVRLAPIKTDKTRGEPYRGPCVYLPHFWGERLVGWQQRWLEEDRPKWVPKYTNTSGFPKTDTIYNYEAVYFAKQSIIVCESVPTVLFLESLGYPAVAIFGASATEEQVRLLRLCQQGITLAPDNDAPGRKWRGLAADLNVYVPVKMIDPVGEYDSGNDLGDLLDEDPRFAAKAVRCLYEEAEYL